MLSQLMRLIVEWGWWMVMKVVKPAFVCWVVHYCILTCAITQIHCGISKSKVVRKIKEQVAKKMRAAYNCLLDLQMAYVHPMSWPMVKFRKSKHTARSYRLCYHGHRCNAIMMIQMLVAFKST